MKESASGRRKQRRYVAARQDEFALEVQEEKRFSQLCKDLLDGIGQMENVMRQLERDPAERPRENLLKTLQWQRQEATNLLENESLASWIEKAKSDNASSVHRMLEKLSKKQPILVEFEKRLKKSLSNQGLDWPDDVLKGDWAVYAEEDEGSPSLQGSTNISGSLPVSVIGHCEPADCRDPEVPAQANDVDSAIHRAAKHIRSAVVLLSVAMFFSFGVYAVLSSSLAPAFVKQFSKTSLFLTSYAVVIVWMIFPFIIRGKRIVE
jgi:hypothetical protein